ncbi:MAG: 7-cyano-7-deazaguanine synthase QueC [Euryarchaeota archaeon]|nr:7-cyano-7-deazaguanine synthase QueC [Euryarchaeota archaeon]
MTELPQYETFDERTQTLTVRSPETAVVLLSGGLDSTVLTTMLVRAYGPENVRALNILYGQRHSEAESMAAELVAGKLGVKLEVIDLESALRAVFDGSGSALVNRGVPVPDGHYEAPTMKSTVVPNRNMLMLSVATARAIVLKATVVAYAAHAGDHSIYPDCRPEFVTQLRQTIDLCDDSPPMLFAPFLHVSKGAIVTEGVKLGAPFHLSYSCYKGGARHCGTCGTCTERKQAFALAGVRDPTEYKVP